MVVQLPDGALVAAVGVQIYSFICLICSSLMILLVYKHREKNSYVALFSYCTFVATAASIAQQLHTIVLWDEIKTRQFYYLREKVGNPEIVIAGPSYGLDLILFYIQYYFYNVEGILILVWAFALAFSIFDPSGPSQPQRVSRRFGVFAKTIAFLQPGLLIGLLQAPVIRKTTAAFLVLADFNLAISLTLGSVFIVAVLIKYIQTRRRLHRWTIRIPPSRDSNNNGGETGQDSESEQSIYDGWLVVRFIIALLFIEAFQILTILSGFSQANNSKEDVMPEQPDLSAARAVVDFVTFIPGVSIGLLAFVVFGTTQNCKRTLYVSFIPQRFRLGAPSTDTHVSASTPRFDNQGTNFLTSPSLEPGSRRASESASSRLEELAFPHTISPYLECGPTESQFVRSRAIGPIENQEDNIKACSFSSFNVSKQNQQGDAQGGQSSVH